MCHQSVTKLQKKSLCAQPVHSAGEGREAASRAVKEKRDAIYVVIFTNLFANNCVFATLSTSRNWNFFYAF